MPNKTITDPLSALHCCAARRLPSSDDHLTPRTSVMNITSVAVRMPSEVPDPQPGRCGDAGRIRAGPSVRRKVRSEHGLPRCVNAASGYPIRLTQTVTARSVAMNSMAGHGLNAAAAGHGAGRPVRR